MNTITGRLENWIYDRKQNILIGELHDDVHKRWYDGCPVTTSRLLPMSEQVCAPKEGATMNTLNSSYLLGKRK